MSACFYSLEMIVRDRYIWCEGCPDCDAMNWKLYRLANEENQ